MDPTNADAASSTKDDETLARQVAVVDQLVDAFGFDRRAAHRAVDESGSTDVQVVASILLDQGHADTGGYVVPITTCRHTSELLGVGQLPLSPFALMCGHTGGSTARSGGLKRVEEETDGACTSQKENWLCLHCGVVRCSRYVHGHGVDHFNETQHCVQVSLSDLSVWCHTCEAYLETHTSETLRPITEHLERVKFGSNTKEEEKDAADSAQQNKEVATDEERESKRIKSNHGTDDDGSDESIYNNVDDGVPLHALDAIPLPGQDEDSDDDEEAQAFFRQLMQMASARGIPLEYLLQQIQSQHSEDNEPVEYPFEEKPQSLHDVANFLRSDKCQKILILAGAGMSVESGIPDFRSANGMYATMDASKLSCDVMQQLQIQADPASALDKPLFMNNPRPCLELMRDFLLGMRRSRWKATLAHRFVELLHSKTGKLARLYTQNIDCLEDQCEAFDLSKRIAVHGSMDRAECANCKYEGMTYEDFCDNVQTNVKDISGQDADAPRESSGIQCPRCRHYTMKPAIVLFREGLPDEFFQNVPSDVTDVDLLIVIGTSLKVAPANSLVWRVPRSAMRVLINREPVGEHLGLDFDDSERDYFAEGNCDEVCLELMQELGWLDDLEELLRRDALPETSAHMLEEMLSRKVPDDAAGD